MSVNRVSVPIQHRRESVQGDRGKAHYGKTVGHEFREGGEEGESLFFFFLFFILFLTVLVSFWIACFVIFFCFCPVFGLFSSVLVQI